MIIVFPVVVFFLIIAVGILGFFITYGINEYLVPFLYLSPDYTMDLKFGCLIALFCLVLGFAIFSKRIESKKFKDYLNKN